MLAMLDRSTCLVMGSALLTALFFMLPEVQEHFVGYILYRGLCVGDTLFHELGHAATSWLFGRPAIPSILTLFGSDKAGGYTPYWGHSWGVQGAVWIILAGGFIWLSQDRPQLKLILLVTFAILVLISFSQYPVLIRAYMGHGGAILCGGVLLYRAWLDIIVKNDAERWFNALFGWFIILNNAQFSYRLAYSPEFNTRYQQSELTMDFVEMANRMPPWSVEQIAICTLWFCVATGFSAFLLAAYFYYDEHYGDY